MTNSNLGALALALAVIALVIALLGIFAFPGPQGPPGMPAAQGLAAVSSTGTLLRGVNVDSVTHPSEGTFRVFFTSNVDVANGYYSLTPGLTGTCATVHSAEITPGNGVFVLFATDAGVLIDCAFTLVVF
ncbi:MAG: hypothetical protein ACE5IJ_04230 [Thermoplasmata archaeon]